MADQNVSPQDLMTINETMGSGAVQQGNNKETNSINKGQKPSTSDAHPPPKTDKPRPHVCTTCNRSFARLEHLKRHERSHTKEKPFECPDCTRCFARRDLLLRHQQKLHMTSTPSSRPRNVRRESASSSTRVRKNSIANGNNNNMRPRANTISHLDRPAVGMVNSVSTPRPPQLGHAHHPSLNSMPSVPNFDLRGIPSDGRHPAINGLTRLDTTAIPINLDDGLRTAPVFGSFGSGYGYGDMMLGQGSTINPAQLHFAGSPGAFMDAPASPFSTAFSNMPSARSGYEDDIKFDFINGFDSTMTLNESAIDNSSPSAMSTGSPSGISEALLDTSNHVLTSSSGPWSATLLSQSQPSQFGLDFPQTTFQDLSTHTETVTDHPFSASPMTNTPFSNMPNNVFHNAETSFEADFANSAFATHANAFTDSTRHALMTSLQQPSAFINRRYSQPASTVAFSAGNFRPPMFDIPSSALPSTHDLQRYINAYITYFHPHLPFIHIPTFDFRAPEHTNKLKSNPRYGNLNMSNTPGDSGSLLLSMAAIGALYEFENAAAKELFESAKKMIQLYLEERRRSDIAARGRSASGHEDAVQNTPLWLIQSMLLNVIYGHSCDDKSGVDIASTHCASLVSLARAAELTQHHPPEDFSAEQIGYAAGMDPQLNGQYHEYWSAQSTDGSPERREWLKWKAVEERKRTLFAIFTLSSTLVLAYNHAPALSNSEIRLSLPCAEELWAADSPAAWIAGGGNTLSEQTSIKFSDALKKLLLAGQKAPQNHAGPNNSSPAELSPSSFGCLVLILALHNYIWETRQQHIRKQWPGQGAEPSIHMHIEPAFQAWQAAWGENPQHSLERPNPSGAGPLSTDSIPLLDLAYVRLYVNLDRSREAFWQRDWNGMVDELSKVVDVSQNVDTNSTPDFGQDLLDEFNLDVGVSGDLGLDTSFHGALDRQTRPTKSEHQLRKAAFYAADSITMADRLGNTYIEFTSRDLPVQNAMCLFDCAQVLAEWVSTVQDRVGPYLGILGQDPVDFSQIPMMLLEEEDYKLIQKIEDILNNIETKMKKTAPSAFSSHGKAWNRLPSQIEGGYAAKISLSAAYLLDRAGVWPVIKCMVNALGVQAQRMAERAQSSLTAYDSMTLPGL